ncbi:MAG: RsbRD N-terminal domain-containing protein [Thermodesulfovibrionales bacterium]
MSSWFDETIKSYPENTATFLREQKNRFTNPVGQTILSGLDSLLTCLQQEEEARELAGFLDNIIRIRAVQDLTPSQAVSFICALKGIVREEVSRGGGGGFSDELVRFEARVDLMMLQAFDIFMQCREKLYDIKANEMRNMTFRILQRANALGEIQEQGKGLDGSTAF